MSQFLFDFLILSLSLTSELHLSFVPFTKCVSSSFLRNSNLALILYAMFFPKGKIWLDFPESSEYHGPLHYTGIDQETWYSVTMTGIVSVWYIVNQIWREN